jgi:hypothetical protein
VNTGFSHVLAPGRIGTMTVRNRVVMSPMETMYGTPDGLPSQRTREETFPSSSPDGIAHILVLHSKFEGGFTCTVRGVFATRSTTLG